MTMNKIMSAISCMSMAYNNSRVINKFISQIKFINHVYRKEDDILIVNLETHKFPFRTSYLTAATLTDVNLADFSFYIENNSLYIRFNDDEIDSVFEIFPTFIHINNVYITEKSYLYKKVKRSLIPIIKEVKCREQMHKQMIDFHNKFKGITSSPTKGITSGTSISRKKNKTSSSDSDSSISSGYGTYSHYFD